MPRRRGSRKKDGDELENLVKEYIIPRLTVEFMQTYQYSNPYNKELEDISDNTQYNPYPDESDHSKRNDIRDLIRYPYGTQALMNIPDNVSAGLRETYYNVKLFSLSTAMNPYQPLVEENKVSKVIAEIAREKIPKLLEDVGLEDDIRLILSEINERITSFNDKNKNVATTNDKPSIYDPNLPSGERIIHVTPNQEEYEYYFNDHFVPGRLEGLTMKDIYKLRIQYPYAWTYYVDPSWLKSIFDLEDKIVEEMFDYYDMNISIKEINDCAKNGWSKRCFTHESTLDMYRIYMGILERSQGLPNPIVLFRGMNLKKPPKVGDAFIEYGLGSKAYVPTISSGYGNTLFVISYPAGHKFATSNIKYILFSEILSFPGEVCMIDEVFDDTINGHKKTVVFCHFVGYKPHNIPTGGLYTPEVTDDFNTWLGEYKYTPEQPPVKNSVKEIDYYDSFYLGNEISTLASRVSTNPEEQIIVLDDNSVFQYDGVLYTLETLVNKIYNLNSPYYNQKDVPQLVASENTLKLKDSTLVTFNGKELPFAQLLSNYNSNFRPRKFNLFEVPKLHLDDQVLFRDFMIPLKDIISCSEVL